MNATFYTFSKRHNSTSQPTGGTTYTIVLKDACSVSNPTIALKWPGNSDPTSFNMCYISAFGRYYWIDNWTYSERQWIASCSVDVLASFKDDIGSASKYVLRAASDYDPDVPDMKYPAKSDLVAAYSAVDTSLNWATSYSNGTIVAGIIGQGNTLSPGGVGYAAMSPATFQQLLSNLFTESEDVWTTSGQSSIIGEALREFGAKLLKSVNNPFQFINSVRWYPFSVGGTAFNAKLGLIQTNVSVNAISLPTHYDTLILSFSSTANGTDGWMNLEPFTEYTLDFPPFGTFSIPASLMLGCSTLTCIVETDVTTGMAELTVTAQPTDPTGTYRRVLHATGKVGVDIQIAGNNIGVLGGLTAGVSSVGAIAGAIAMPTAGSIAGALSAVGSAAGSLAPAAQSSGAQGSLAGIFREKVLWIRRRTPADQDVTEQGRPLCQVKTISSLSGFIQCADGDLSTAARPAEYTQIKNFLTGGFFYE